MCDFIIDIMKQSLISYMILYLDALFVQLPSVYGLQCWVSNPQFTSTSFTLPVNSRGRDRFLITITLIVRSVGQICLEGPQVLQMTLA
jgi:hypothetical protein